MRNLKATYIYYEQRKEVFVKRDAVLTTSVNLDKKSNENVDEKPVVSSENLD